MLGFFKEDEDDKKLMEDVVKHYQPSMRLTENGCGGWCIAMSKEDDELLKDVVKYYESTMRVVSSGFGDWMLTMNPKEGRGTARIHGEEDDERSQKENSGKSRK